MGGDPAVTHLSPQNQSSHCLQQPLAAHHINNHQRHHWRRPKDSLGAPLPHWSPKEADAVIAIQDVSDCLDAIGTRHVNIILGESATTNVALASPLANTNTELTKKPACAHQRPAEHNLSTKQPQHTQSATPNPATQQTEPTGTTTEPTTTSQPSTEKCTVSSGCSQPHTGTTLHAHPPQTMPEFTLPYQQQPAVTSTTSSNRGRDACKDTWLCPPSSTLATQQDLQREQPLSTTTRTHPNTRTPPPPGNNPPSTSKLDVSQRLPTPLAQATANHKHSTLGKFPHNYLQGVRDLVTHTTLPLNPPSFVF